MTEHPLIFTDVFEHTDEIGCHCPHMPGQRSSVVEELTRKRSTFASWVVEGCLFLALFTLMWKKQTAFKLSVFSEILTSFKRQKVLT